MANIFDYLDWRSDISFEQVGLNEVDALILARLVYLPLENYIPNSISTFITIEELYTYFDHEKETYIMENDKPLFEKLAKSIRFKDIRISGLKSKFHTKQEEQFCAVLFESPTFSYVSFRGTDGSFIGWKEDFNLSFMSEIPSQKDALDYVNSLGQYKQDLILGGHSKGGNLAIYSGIFTDAKIKKIYNFDGPGFDKTITENKAFQKRMHLIRSYIPQSSLIGLILHHPESCYIVKSTSKTPYSHDIYTWEIMGSKIVQADKYFENSKFIANTMEKWRNEMTPEERRNVVDTIYNLIAEEPTDTIPEWKANWYSKLKNTFNEYRQMDPEARDQIFDSLAQLFDSAKSTFTDMTKKGED